MVKHLLIVVVAATVLAACGSNPPPPPLTPEEIEAREIARAEAREARQRDRRAEAEELGLLSLNDAEQAQFVAEFLSRLRYSSSIDCDLLAGLGFLDSTTYAIRCANGTEFVARLSGDTFYSVGTGWAAMTGGDIDDAIWFIGDDAPP